MRKERPPVIDLTRGEALAGWVYLPFYVIGLSLLLGIVMVLLGLSLADLSAQLWLNVIYGTINATVLLIAFRGYLRRSLTPVRQKPVRFLIALVLGFALYYFGTALMELLTEWILPSLENVNDASIEQMAATGPLRIVFFTVICAPLSEELLFRGLVFTSLRRHSRFAAYAVSITAFSLIHVLGYLGTYPTLTLALCFVQYLPASFALALVMELSGSVWCSIGVHVLANAAAMLAIL